MFVYSTLVTDANGDVAVLIVTSQLQPLNETVKILSEQLIYVTVGILGIAFVLSFVIAQKVRGRWKRSPRRRQCFTRELRRYL